MIPMKLTSQKIFFLAILIAILSSTVSFSQTGSGQTNKVKPTIVLVHGLWADGSAWNKVTSALQAQEQWLVLLCLFDYCQFVKNLM